MTVVGLQPWLPGPLARSPSWTRPVRAERLAALRIGVGLVLLWDVLGTYLPRCADLFGSGGLCPAGTWTVHASAWEWHRTLLDRVEAPGLWCGLLWTWAAAALLLTVGLWARPAAAVAWFFGVSITTLNPIMHNSGDFVRNTILFFLIFCPCGAAWSLDAWRRCVPREPVLIHPWPLRLLLVQLVVIYFMNGLYKVCGEGWLAGNVLGQLVGNVGWTRYPFAAWPIPAPLLQIGTWTVLAWELSFPWLLWQPRLRVPALLLGVVFHLGTGLMLKLAAFPLYMLCLYLPLIPWERWAVAGPDQGEPVSLSLHS